LSFFLHVALARPANHRQQFGELKWIRDIRARAKTDTYDGDSKHWPWGWSVL
jgi:hypothetical protein